MLHHKFNEVLTMVEANIPVLLTGEKGSGKTTLAKQVSEHLKIDFFSVSMTRQTTLSHLLGFMSVNGTYVPSQLRKVAEEGGAFLLDEIDAGDANVLLALNTIENGFISFPDGIVELHKDFRLLATANPQDQHDHYVGRSKLDAATLDRFDEINIDHDDNLERSLVDPDVFMHIDALRSALASTNSSITISMRDAMRFQKRKELSMLDNYAFRLTRGNQLAFEAYEQVIASIPKFSDQADCNNIDDLYDLIKLEAQNAPASPPASPPPNYTATDYAEYATSPIPPNGVV